MKKILWITGSLAVMAALFFGLRAAGITGGRATTQPADTTVYQVQRGDIVRAVASSGKIVANLNVDIKCRASGEVIRLPFDVSDAVKKGTLLLELDPADQQRDVKRFQAAVAQSQARLAQAHRNLELAELEAATSRKRAEAAVNSRQVQARAAEARVQRRRQLIQEKLGALEDLENAEAEAASANADLEGARVQLEEVKLKELTVKLRKNEVEMAQAQLQANEIELDNARQQLAYTRVEAPIDGVVCTRDIQIGTIISSGITNVGGGTTIMTLSDISRIFILAAVDEADIGQVKLEQLAEVTVDAFPREQFTGKVVRIATQGVNTSNVVTFEVKIEITSANKQLLKPQMTGNVRIISEQCRQTLIIPQQALTKANGKTTVTIPAHGQAAAEERTVELGLSDEDNVQVLSGLSEGQSILVRKDVTSKWNQQKKAAGPPPPH